MVDRVFRWLALVALLLSHASPAQEVLRSCSLSAPLDTVGLKALEADCPGVERALADSSYSVFISERQESQLRRDSLADLLVLQSRFEGRAPPRASLDAAAAKQAVSSLSQPAAQVASKSWLQSLEDWVEEYLSRASKRNDWVGRWLRDVDRPKTQADWLLGILAVLIVGLAIAVVVMELRASGVLRRHGRLQASAEAAEAMIAGITLEDLQSVPPRERTAVLLKWLVAALQRSGRIQAEQALTHRELGHRAAFDDAQQRAAFGAIATLAEITLYGGREPTAEELAQAVDSGKRMHPQLSRPVGSPA